MEKKRYNRPTVTNTRIDYSITLTQTSQTPPPTPPPEPGGLGGELPFFNPLKWFK
jgi:hypothetical protein